MDLAALGAAARNAPGNGAVWSAIAFMVAAPAPDIVVAPRLDRRTGKAAPADAGRPGTPALAAA